MAGFRWNSKNRQQAAENYCKLCRQMFCCRNCRSIHDQTIHKIVVNCDICVYGKIWSGSIFYLSSTLLTHIEINHFPMNCLYCRIIFKTIDDLFNHKSCTKSMKTPTTPLTPNSLMFCESFKPVSNNQNYFSMILTSTPMQKIDDNDKITPLNDDNNVKLILKSNLKSSLNLRSNSGLSESRKSDRRVTFSDTPLIRFSPINTEKSDDSDNTDDTFYSMTDIEIKDPVQVDEENSSDNQSVTLWESAICSNDDWNSTSESESNISKENISINVNITRPVSLITSQETSASNVEQIDQKSLSLWSSVTKIVKSVVHNISITTQHSFVTGNKRRHPDPDITENEIVPFKKRKFTDIKCRRTIREIHPRYRYQFKIKRPIMIDKSTQTDDIFWEKI